MAETDQPDLTGLSELPIDHGGTVILFPPSAVVLGVRQDGKLALVRQYRQIAKKHTLELPGGRVEPGESISKAAKRELLEETGFKCSRLKRIFSLDLDFSASWHLTHVFTATIDATKQSPASFEVKFVSPLVALRYVVTGKITHAPTVAALLWAELHQRHSK